MWFWSLFAKPKKNWNKIKWNVEIDSLNHINLNLFDKFISLWVNENFFDFTFWIILSLLIDRVDRVNIQKYYYTIKISLHLVSILFLKMPKYQQLKRNFHCYFFPALLLHGFAKKMRWTLLFINMSMSIYIKYNLRIIRIIMKYNNNGSNYIHFGARMSTFGELRSIKWIAQTQKHTHK